MTEEGLDGYVDGDDFVITRDCPRCKVRQEVRVKSADFIAWQREGIKIQHAFPYLDANQREMLQTGVCQKCWDTLFGEEI